jgi:hypothetical protein
MRCACMCACSAIRTHSARSTCAITPKQADMRKATAKTTTEGIFGWSGGGSGLRRASSAGPVRVCVPGRRCALDCSWLGADSCPRCPGIAAQQGGIVLIHAVVIRHEAASMAIVRATPTRSRSRMFLFFRTGGGQCAVAARKSGLKSGVADRDAHREAEAEAEAEADRSSPRRPVRSSSVLAGGRRC